MELPAQLEDRFVVCRTAGNVRGVDASDPAPGEFIFESIAGKTEPVPVEECAVLVGTGGPQHNRKGVGNGSKLSLALVHPTLLRPRSVGYRNALLRPGDGVTKKAGD